MFIDVCVAWWGCFGNGGVVQIPQRGPVTSLETNASIGIRAIHKHEHVKKKTVFSLHTSSVLCSAAWVQYRKP